MLNKVLNVPVFLALSKINSLNLSTINDEKLILKNSIVALRKFYQAKKIYNT